MLYEIEEGNKLIYSEPNVTEGKIKPGALEKPVHEDVRGTIHRLEFSGTKLNTIFTRKRFMRSGDFHPNTQFDLILSGKIELWTLENGETIKKVLGPNTFVVIRPNVPHLFNFLEDSLMMEWWDGPFKAWFYRPYRDIIDKQFRDMTS